MFCRSIPRARTALVWKNEPCLVALLEHEAVKLAHIHRGDLHFNVNKLKQEKIYVFLNCIQVKTRGS